MSLVKRMAYFPQKLRFFLRRIALGVSPLGSAANLVFIEPVKKGAPVQAGLKRPAQAGRFFTCIFAVKKYRNGVSPLY